MKLSYRDIDGYYCAIVVDEDDEISFFRGGTASRWTKPLKFTDLIAFAKAGGKVSEVDKSEGSMYDKAGCYETVRARFDIGYGGVWSFIDDLIAERDTLKAELVVCERDMASMNRTIEARTAQVAKLTKGKVTVVNKVRCIDCEHLRLDTVNVSLGICGCDNHQKAIYAEGICCDFTKAIAGCGSADQALRAELARVTEESGK